jgi:alpha-tubulin suppressor-like RCC1 family protein
MVTMKRMQWAGLAAIAAALMACSGDDVAPAGPAGVGGGTGGGPASSSSTTSGSGGEGGEASIVDSITIEAVGICAGSCFEVYPGEERELLAHVYDHDGNEISMPVTWASSDDATLTVSDAGMALGVAEGSVTVSATAQGVTGTAGMTVLPALVMRIEVSPGSTTLNQIGATETFTAVAYDQQDNVIPDAPISWIASNPHVGSITQGGVLTGVEQGHTIIQAGSGFATGWAEATVIGPISTTPPWTLLSVSGGGHHGCGVTAANAAYCWGWNYFGQLGNGEVGDNEDNEPTPVAVVGGHSFSSIVAGLYHTCAITTTGAAWCWGQGGSGELGNGDDTVFGSMVPLAVAGGHTFAKLAAGGSHTCGITTAGALYCWGLGTGGALGTGGTSNSWTPLPVAAGTVFEDIVTGLWHTCAITDASLALCWGANDQGQAGNDSAAGMHTSPVAVAGGHEFASLDSYASHTCGVELDGTLWCWGRNDTAQLGDGTLTPQVAHPVQVDTLDLFSDVATAAHHTCAVTTDGDTQCWGHGGYGQLGQGELSDSTVPVDVLGGLDFVDIAAGSHFTCGSLANNGVYCWGDSSFGQLGAGFGDPGNLSAVPAPLDQP